MAKKVREGIKYWCQIFLLPLYGLSYITPRSKRIWVYGSTFGRRFADNPRYLYLYTSQLQSKEISSIWISRKKSIVAFLKEHGYRAYYIHSFKGIYYCLRAGVYIFDNYSKDASFWLSGGAKKVNLWHGVGNKRINYDNKFDKVRHPSNNRERFKTYLRRLSDEKPSHYILATSPVKVKIFSSAFRVDMSHMIEDGLPRNDTLLDMDFTNIYTSDEQALLDRIKDLRKRGVIINGYMPTFRQSETRFFEIMDFERFNRYLIDKNMMFVIKLHPKSKLIKEFENIRYSNVISISPDIDTYTFLRYVDVLTTDYSSVYTDFMLLNRPVIGFYYDFDLYSQDTRECYFDFEEYMPELKAKDMKELMDMTDSVLLSDKCLENRMKSRNMMFSNPEMKSCESIYKKINLILEGNKNPEELRKKL